MLKKIIMAIALGAMALTSLAGTGGAQAIDLEAGTASIALAAPENISLSSRILGDLESIVGPIDAPLAGGTPPSATLTGSDGAPLFVSQQGKGNIAELTSIGRGNLLAIEQVGSGNVARVYQKGTGNTLLVRQVSR